MKCLIQSPDEGVMPPKRYSVVGTSGLHPSQNFRLKLELPARAGTSSKLNKKGCLGLAFWILIRTVPNLWKTWKISLGKVSYWDKTNPLHIYGRIMDD
jgi:hypothetical protein